jgi:hypothetical protein
MSPMKIAPLFALLLVAAAAGCSVPAPPSTPPLPSTPPPPPPEREVNAVTVSGRVTAARGGYPVGFASVWLYAADAACRRGADGIGTLTDENGQYHAVVEVGPGPALRGCVVVEARSGGSVAEASAPAYFASSRDDRQAVQVDLALPRVAPATAADAERLALQLAEAINDPNHPGLAELALYVHGGVEALRVALDQYRQLFGSVRSVAALPADWAPLPFELRGENGRTGRVTVDADDLVRLHSPLLDYGYRAERFATAYLRLIGSGDAERLAQLLNPDDVDFPVERARELIVAYRQRYADLATTRAAFESHDERQNTITFRITGRGRSGGELSELLVLRYGDGLLGVVGL